MLRTLSLAMLCTVLAGAAGAADYYAPPPARPGVYGALPACGEPSVLASITEKFAYQDSHLTLRGLSVKRIDRVHERRFRPGAPGFVERRYCGATALLSNGRRAAVSYLIEGPQLGLFSIGWHVESCLTGHDPYRVYDGACRSISP